MATTYTTNYNLGKQTDKFDKLSMAVITDNMDKIDIALNNKVDKDGNKVLSDNNFTNDEKTKLDNITNPMQLKGRVDTFSALPSNPSIGDLYLVGLATATQFDEYVYTQLDGWERLGQANINLGNYYTKLESDAKYTLKINFDKSESEGIARKALTDTNYYFKVMEHIITDTTTFVGGSGTFLVRNSNIISTSSQKDGILRFAFRYDQNGDGTDDNTFVVVQLYWILNKNIDVNDFVLCYNNVLKKLELYCKVSTRYLGYIVKYLDGSTVDINGATNYPFTMLTSTTGQSALPTTADGWTTIVSTN